MPKAVGNDDIIQLLDDSDGDCLLHPEEKPWRLLIVDDDDDVHKATRFALRGIEIEGRQVELLSAHSAAEGEAVVRGQPDIACILLDVVMETPDAGLSLVRVIRDVVGNRAVRIILRTGQPGEAPEFEVVQRYDINDYKHKSELNRTRLLTTLVAAFRSYRQFRALESRTAELEESRAELIYKSQALETLSRAVEQSPVSVIITSPDATIEYVNPKVVELTGYSEAEMIGRNPRILQSGLTPPETYLELWECLTAGRTWEGELQNRKKSGELYWEHASISPIRAADGSVIHFVAVKEDITQRKAIEAELLSALTAAREADHAKTVFLSHMSHELRTPMTAVLGYAEMMEAELAGPLSATYKDYVAAILGGGRHLLSIIDDLLEVSRIELGRYAITVTDFDLAGTIASCASMIVPLCTEKRISLVVSETPSLPVSSDEHALRQIMVNLLANAVKYTSPNGAITIRGKSLGQSVEIAIEDTGRGIPEDLLDKIFEPFHRADPLRADPSRGVGLGLAICQRIAGLLHGELQIRSEVGKGTSVSVIIPVTTA